MSPRLTDEMRTAINERAGGLVEIEDDQTQKTYVLIERQQASGLLGEALRRELQIGFDQADGGESQSWNIQQTLAEAHRRHADSSD